MTAEAKDTVAMADFKLMTAERDKYRVEMETLRLEKEDYRKQAENHKLAVEELQYKVQKEREACAAHQENINNLHAEIEKLNGLRQINNELLVKLRKYEEAATNG